MKCSNYLIVHKELPLLPDGPCGGAEMATRHLARFLAASGKKVVLAGLLQGDELESHGVSYWSYGRNYDIAGVLKRAAEQFDTFHLIATGRALPLLEARSYPAVQSKILISHDRSGSDAGISLSVVSEIADAILAVSEAHRTELIRAGADSNKVSVIYNGVDYSIFTEGPASARDPYRLVFAGALVPDKGLQLLLQAYAHLKQKLPRLSLDVYGSAELWGREPVFDTRTLMQQLPGVTFHGAVSQKELAQAFCGAGLLVFPSIWFETFGLTPVEAQATGCPVIAFDVGGVREGVSHGESGIIVPEITAEALTREIEILLNTPERLQQLGARAAKFVRERFSWEKVAEKVVSAADGVAQQVKQAVGGTATAVGVISTWNQQCGLATYANYLFSEFPAGSVIVFAEDAEDAQREKDQPWIVRCWQRRGDDLKMLERAIVQSGVRLLHLNFHDHSFIEHLHLLPFLARLRQQGITLISHLHTTYAAEPRFTQFIAHVDRLIVHTPESRLQVIASGASPEQVLTLPHGVLPLKRPAGADRERIRRTLMPDPNARLIASFGFVQPNKGVEAVLEAVAHLSSRGILAHGLIAGKVNEAHPQSRQYFNELQLYAQRLGISNRITFSNRFLTEREVADCLAVADLVTMNYGSQYYEASGACARAVGAGALVATSLSPNFNSFGDAVWHLTSGFPIGPSAELLFTNQKLVDEVLSNAARYVREHRWSEISRRLRSFYQSLGFKIVASTGFRGVNSRSVKVIEPLSAEQIDKLTEQGEAALRNGELQKARETLLGLIERAPQAERALRALGTLALSEKNVTEARDFFNRARELQPVNAKTLGGLGMCAISEGDLTQAHNYLLESLAHDPGFLLGLKNLIHTSFSLEKYEDLERGIRQYLARYPEDNEIQYCLAGCLYKKGETTSAVRVLEAILERTPSHANAREFIDRIQAEQTRASGEALTQDSARIDLRISELEEAKRQNLLDAVYRGVDELERAPLSVKQMERVFILRAETLTLDNQLVQARAIFKQVLEANPASGRAMSGLGALLLAEQNVAGAEELFTQALLKHERLDIALTGLGLCAQWRGDPATAWEYYRKALKDNPENEQALYGAVQIGMLRRNFAEVEGCLRGYLELRPANLDHLYSLAGCLYAQQRFIEALDELDKLLLFEPRHANALELKKIILSKGIKGVQSAVSELS